MLFTARVEAELVLLRQQEIMLNAFCFIYLVLYLEIFRNRLAVPMPDKDTKVAEMLWHLSAFGKTDILNKPEQYRLFSQV
jgi:hypothetical protein